MEVERINPAALWQPALFTQVVAARGGKLVFVSGQVAFDARQQLVGGGDLARQAQVAFQNLRLALAAGGATPGDVVKLNVYVVNYQERDIAAVEAAIGGCFGPWRGFACTLVGVTSLARAGLLIEVEAVAVVSDEGGPGAGEPNSGPRTGAEAPAEATARP